jgi:Calcineurin-like phosphoesterase
MYFIGDVHGKVHQYRDVLRELPVGAKSIQVGDMGLGFKGVYLHDGGIMANGHHKFIRGNHDSPTACHKHKWYLGDYGVTEDGIFYCGGAWSIDAKARTPQVTWWPGEEQSAVALNAAVQLYDAVKPRIVVSHEAPSSVIRTLIFKYINAKLINEYADYYEQKAICRETRTAQALQEMLERHQPDHWVFGHYHFTQDFQALNYKTQFYCIAELDVINIDPPKE